MSDEALRRVERDLALAPDSLELRRQHLQLLRRAGAEERALSALDLAWRLGAEELWDELQAALEARKIELPGLVLRYVPAGPFGMGTDQLDQDAAPPHLVELGAFWIAARPLAWGAMDGWRGHQVSRWPGHEERTFTPDGLAGAQETLAHLTATHGQALGGSFSLPSEAQWERALRASYLREDGVSPYGVVPAERASSPEWCADAFDPDWYARSPRVEPVGPESGELRVVRGAPGIPDPAWALFREAARPDGSFQVGGLLRTRWVRHEHLIALRPVLRSTR